MQQLIAALALAVVAGQVAAEPAQRDAVFGNWAVYVAESPRQCIVTAEASSETGWPDTVIGSGSAPEVAETAPEENSEIAAATGTAEGAAAGTQAAPGGEQSRLLVIWRENAAGVVTFQPGGHALAAGSALTLRAGDVVVPMFTDGDWAWTASRDADSQVIGALGTADRADIALVAEGGSAVGVIFALDGFADAAARASVLCAGA